MRYLLLALLALAACKKDEDKQDTDTNTYKSHTIAFEIECAELGNPADTATFFVTYTNQSGTSVDTTLTGVKFWTSDTMRIDTGFTLAHITVTPVSASTNPFNVRLLVDDTIKTHTIGSLSATTPVVLEYHVQ